MDDGVNANDLAKVMGEVRGLEWAIALLRLELFNAGLLKELIPLEHECAAHNAADSCRASLLAKGFSEQEADNMIEVMRASHDAVYGPLRRLAP